MAAIAAATVMTSCSKDNEAVDNNEPVAVQFASGIADVQTRVDETTWAAGDAAGIYMIGAAGGLTATNIREGADNRQYTASAGTTANFSPVSGDANRIYYPVSGNVKFVAYYPYGTVTDFKRSFSVASQSSLSAIDIMYAPAGTTYSKTSGTVNLPFEHKLVKLVFNITNGAGVTEAVSNGITVGILGQQTAGELDLTDGSVSKSGAPATITITATGTATVEAIVLPSTNMSGMSFTFTNDASETFAGSIPPNTSWVGGNKYTYTVTLQKSEAVITGTISPWTSSGTTYPVTGE